VSFLQVGACYNARVIGFVSGRTHVHQDFCQTSRTGLAGRTRFAPLFHLALPFYSGDTAYYEELARNWLYHGVYGFYSHGQLVASDARAPGYPAFLAAIYFLAGTGRMAVMLAQAFVDLATCVLAAGIAHRLATGVPDPARTRVAAAALWLTALCPFTANYAAVPLTEVLATFFTTLALLIFLSPRGWSSAASPPNAIFFAVQNLVRGRTRGWPRNARSARNALLLGAVLIFLWLRYRRREYWSKLALATLWMIVGVLLPLAPWAARNAVSLGASSFSRRATQNVRRRFADRLLCLDENVDVPFFATPISSPGNCRRSQST